jgi:hypothetical protein
MVAPGIDALRPVIYKHIKSGALAPNVPPFMETFT